MDFSSMFVSDSFEKIELKHNCFVLRGTLASNLMPSETELSGLWNDRPKTRNTYHIYGKTVDVPRYLKFYSLRNLLTAFGGQTFGADMVDDASYTARVLKACPSRYGYNSVLINWYMTGSDYVAMHGDKERGLVQTTPIISVSLGASRRFTIQDVATKEMVFDSILKNGECIIMSGSDFQYKYKHSVPKMVAKKHGVVGPRINLTLRQYAS